MAVIMTIRNKLGWVLVAFVAVLAFGLWLGYRIVNVPQFADFLIAVEAEMNKVSWPIIRSGTRMLPRSWRLTSGLIR